MEAPEKIYLFENPITETSDDRWLSKRSDDEDIEYTRTDAFIEKACELLKSTMYNDDVWGVIVSGKFHTVEEFIRYFKKAMEGGEE